MNSSKNIIDKVWTQEKIFFEISPMLENNVGIIDAILVFCEKNEVEIETIANIIKRSQSFKEMIGKEAFDLNLLRE